VSKGTIKVKFANGFGNNLFRYCFCRLLAEYHGLNYSHPSIPELGIKQQDYSFNKNLKTIKFKAKSNLEAKKFDKDHHKYFDRKMGNCNYDFSKFVFYFEDYKLYKPYLNKIRSWFPKVKSNNKSDLVLHLRLENRIVQETHYKNIIDSSVYEKIILDNFKFNKLYIVTDAYKWGHYSKKDILKLHKKYIGEGTSYVPIKKSIKYINNMVDVFEKFNPIIKHSEKLIDDFNFIRSFDHIMFKNSTFAWWASLLSDASKIAVFGPWKPNKGKRNKNLGETNFKGWFKWGEDDC